MQRLNSLLKTLSRGVIISSTVTFLIFLLLRVLYVAGFRYRTLILLNYDLVLNSFRLVYIDSLRVGCHRVSLWSWVIDRRIDIMLSVSRQSIDQNIPLRLGLLILTKIWDINLCWCILDDMICSLSLNIKILSGDILIDTCDDFSVRKWLTNLISIQWDLPNNKLLSSNMMVAKVHILQFLIKINLIKLD